MADWYNDLYGLNSLASVGCGGFVAGGDCFPYIQYTVEPAVLALYTKFSLILRGVLPE